ncbi:MAG: UPF0104 family protein [Betaproteobacteria bacterium]|nr:UPF0104 family protein [Betaproteobacteria bacterium]
METSSALRQWIKPAVGLALVLAVLAQLQAAALIQTLKSTDPQWLLASLALACCSNFACGLRWRKIVSQLGWPLEKRQAFRLYFEGIAANTILPGGIIGGDIWRVLGLSKMGISKQSATQSVVTDRAIGFWALSTLSLVAFSIWFALEQGPTVQASQELIGIYLMSLVSVSVLPALVWRLKAQWVRGMLLPAGISMVTQVLAISAFFCCLVAVRAEVSALAVATLCAGIFLGAAIPASIGGFGSRELASVFFLVMLGVQPEEAFLASVFFGLTATLQGLAVLPLWITRHSRREGTPSLPRRQK